MIELQRMIIIHQKIKQKFKWNSWNLNNQEEGKNHSNQKKRIRLIVKYQRKNESKRKKKGFKKY